MSTKKDLILELKNSLQKVFGNQKIKDEQNNILKSRNFRVITINPYNTKAAPESTAYNQAVFDENIDGSISIKWANVGVTNLGYVLAVIYGTYSTRENSFSHENDELLTSWINVLKYGKRPNNIEFDPDARQEILGNL